MIFIVHPHVHTSAHSAKWAAKVLLFFELTKKFVIFFQKKLILMQNLHISKICSTFAAAKVLNYEKNYFYACSDCNDDNSLYY